MNGGDRNWRGGQTSEPRQRREWRLRIAASVRKEGGWRRPCAGQHLDDACIVAPPQCPGVRRPCRPGPTVLERRLEHRCVAVRGRRERVHREAALPRSRVRGHGVKPVVVRRIHHLRIGHVAAYAAGRPGKQVTPRVLVARELARRVPRPDRLVVRALAARHRPYDVRQREPDALVGDRARARRRREQTGVAAIRRERDLEVGQGHAHPGGVLHRLQLLVLQRVGASIRRQAHVVEEDASERGTGVGNRFTRGVVAVAMHDGGGPGGPGGGALTTVAGWCAWATPTTTHARRSEACSMVSAAPRPLPPGAHAVASTFAGRKRNPAAIPPRAPSNSAACPDTSSTIASWSSAARTRASTSSVCVRRYAVVT